MIAQTKLLLEWRSITSIWIRWLAIPTVDSLCTIQKSAFFTTTTTFISRRPWESWKHVKSTTRSVRPQTGELCIKASISRSIIKTNRRRMTFKLSRCYSNKQRLMHLQRSRGLKIRRIGRRLGKKSTRRCLMHRLNKKGWIIGRTCGWTSTRERSMRQPFKRMRDKISIIYHTSCLVSREPERRSKTNSSTASIWSRLHSLSTTLNPSCEMDLEMQEILQSVTVLLIMDNKNMQLSAMTINLEVKIIILNLSRTTITLHLIPLKLTTARSSLITLK